MEGYLRLEDRSSAHWARLASCLLFNCPAVDDFQKFLSRSERWDVPLWHPDLLACLGITPHPRLLSVYPEGTEHSELHLIPCIQGVLYGFENGLNVGCRKTLRKVCRLRKQSDLVTLVVRCIFGLSFKSPYGTYFPVSREFHGGGEP